MVLEGYDLNIVLPESFSNFMSIVYLWLEYVQEYVQGHFQEQVFFFYFFAKKVLARTKNSEL